MYFKRIFPFPVLITFLLVVMGCITTFSKFESELEVVPLPKEEWDNVAWIDQWLILQKGIGKKYGQTLWKVHIDGSNLEELQLPDNPECEKIGYEFPTRLPNGKLGYFINCGFNDSTKSSLEYLVSYDLETGISTTLLNYPLETNGRISWNPEMDKGITSLGSIIVNHLYWFTPETSQKIQLDFTSQAFGAVWSPDGKQIAFVAAPENNRQGLSRLDVDYNLYLMDSSGENIHPIVRKFKHPIGVVWSPDGKYVTFKATFDNKNEGLWIYSIESESIYFLAEGDFIWYEWASDSQHIVSTRQSSFGIENPDEIVIIKLIGIENDSN